MSPKVDCFTLEQMSNLSLAWKTADIFKMNMNVDDDDNFNIIVYFYVLL